jgi:hypothetical protein
MLCIENFQQYICQNECIGTKVMHIQIMDVCNHVCNRTLAYMSIYTFWKSVAIGELELCPNLFKNFAQCNASCLPWPCHIKKKNPSKIHTTITPSSMLVRFINKPNNIKMDRRNKSLFVTWSTTHVGELHV